MNAPITLSIKLFGTFRKYHAGTLDVAVAAGSSAQTVKSAIATALRQINPAFADDELISKSALANQQRVFGNDETFVAAADLAILPPVCGG